MSNSPQVGALVSHLFKGVTVLVDGGVSTELFARGAPVGKPPELWNLERPEEVLAVHRAYLASGAQWITTNTFGSNAGRFANSDDRHKLKDINHAAVRIAKEVAQDTDAVVAGSVGPTGLTEAASDEGLAAIYSEQIGYLIEAGVDLIAGETMSNQREIRAFGCAVERPGGAFTCTFSLHGIKGDSLQEHLQTLLDSVLPFRPLAVGINCGEGVVQALQALEVLTSLTNLPKIARPNAGQPTVDNGVARYSLASEAFGQWAVEASQAGASIIGGCCGVSPEHISAACSALCLPHSDRVNHD